MFWWFFVFIKSKIQHSKVNFSTHASNDLNCISPGRSSGVRKKTNYQGQSNFKYIDHSCIVGHRL